MVRLGVAVALGALSATACSDDDVTVERDVGYRRVDGDRLTADVYFPSGESAEGGARPAVLVLHGGGWRAGGSEDLEEVAERLADEGFVAVALDYRLAPEHPYPAAVEDVQAAVRWLRDPAVARRYGIDPARIGALGDSAGGHLAGMLATLGEGALDFDARIAVAVAWSPPMDLVTTAMRVDRDEFVVLESAINDFFPCTSGSCTGETARLASPATYVDPTDAPMLLANSDDDIVIPMDIVTPMVDRLAAAGVEHELIVVPGDRHGHQYADEVWDETIAFLQAHLGERAGGASASDADYPVAAEVTAPDSERAVATS